MMISRTQMLLSLAILLFVLQFAIIDSLHSRTKSATSFDVQPKFISKSHLIFKLRAGEAILIGKRKKQKPTFVYMIKAFFSSMVDPTYSGQVELLTDKQKKAAKTKGKKHKLGAGPYGMAGPVGGSFGSVCGPNGCT